MTSTVNGRPTATPVFIPAATHEGQSLAPGDSAVSGHLNLTSTSSSCAAPKSAPTTSGNESRFYDTFTVTSLVNEPACVWVRPDPTGPQVGSCLAFLVLYSPTFVPADLRSNYAG